MKRGEENDEVTYNRQYSWATTSKKSAELCATHPTLLISMTCLNPTSWHRTSSRIWNRSRKGIAQRSNQVNTVRTHARGEAGNGDDPSSLQAQFLGHHPHNLLVAKHVRSADIENLSRCFRHREHADQIFEYVPDRCRLTRSTYPFRRNHYRQALNEITHHLKRSRA